MIILAVLIQHITGRFCFIKKTAGTRDLDNRWFTIFVAMYCRAPILSDDISRCIGCSICVSMKSVSSLAPEIQNRSRSNVMSLIVLLSDKFSVVLCIWLTPSRLFSSLAEVICSCSPTCCSQSMFWSGCSWQCGAWSSQPCSTSSTWAGWISVFLTAMWRHSTQVSRNILHFYTDAHSHGVTVWCSDQAKASRSSSKSSAL